MGSTAGLPVSDSPDIPQRISLTSLPTELLNKILRSLDDYELLRHVTTCRTLHHFALHIVFERHCETFSGQTLVLSGYPDFILPALRRALFIQDLTALHITFGDPPFRLLLDIKDLAVLIRHLNQNRTLVLDFSKVGRCVLDKDYFKPGFGEFATSLQRLLDTALNCGCNHLRIVTGVSFTALTHYPQRVQRPEPGRLRPLLGGLVSKIAPIFRNKDTQDAPQHTGISSPVVPRHANTMQGGAFSLFTDILFDPHLLDWTLSFLNHSSITTFVTRFPDDTWQGILPQIHMTHLTNFHLAARGIDFRNLMLFLMRHSSTLTSISLDLSYPLDFSRPSVVPSSFWPFRVAGTFNFPRLSHLSPSSHCVSKFFEFVRSGSPKGSRDRYLPSLFQISILSSSYYRSDSYRYLKGKCQYLKEALKSIAEITSINLSRGLNPTESTRFTLWLNIVDIGAPELVAWFQSYATGPSTASLVNLPMVRSLQITTQMSWDWDAQHSVFTTLPTFLSLFKGLRHLGFDYANVERLREYEVTYWESVRRCCPELETVWLGDQEFVLNDLLKGDKGPGRSTIAPLAPLDE